MKRFTELLSGSAAVLFQVALTGWMFALSEINFDFVTMELNYVLISAVMLCAYYLNMVMMRRGVPVPLFALAELLLVAVGIFAFVRAVRIEPYELRTVIVNCIIYCLGFAVAAFLSWNPTNQNGILMRFDALAIMIVVMLVLDHVLVMPGARGCLNMCYVCLVLTILSAVSIKSGALAGRGSAVEGNGALGRVLLFILAGIMGLLGLLVIIYAASGVKSFSQFLLNIIKVCINAVKTVIVYLYSLLERLVQWLSQFAKDEPMEPLGIQQFAGNVETEAMEEVAVSIPVWIYYVIAAIAAAAVIYMIFRLRKLRTVKIQSHAVVITKVRRESGLMKALRELWEKLKTELRFRWNCLRYRRSPAGLLVWCEKKSPEDLRRHTDESGEKYLLRLGCSLGGEAEKVLLELAELVERSFYSRETTLVPPGLYKAVKKTKFKLNK